MAGSIYAFVAIAGVLLVSGHCAAQADDMPPPAAPAEKTVEPPKPDFAMANPRWVYDAKANCWALDIIVPTSPVSFTWTGDCKDNRISGTGTLGWYYTGVLGLTIKGTFVRGALNGFADATWADGGHYEGEFKDSVINGTGKETWPSGDRYEGQYRDGKFDGQGQLFNAPQTQYSGGFRNGKYDGQGVLTIGDNRMDGEFGKGRFVNGHARNIAPDGSRFDGKITDGKEEGQGTLVFVSGTYEGQFHLNEMSGPGVLHRPDGTTLKGIAEAPREDTNPPVQVVYPPISRRLSEQGVAVVAYTVETDGRVTNTRIAKSSGFERLDVAAMDAAAAMHYAPARMAGIPIVITRSRAFRFALR
jgi:TonB family protein